MIVSSTLLEVVAERHAVDVLLPEDDREPLQQQTELQDEPEISGAFAEMTTSGEVARIAPAKRQPYSTSCTARWSAEYFENWLRSGIPMLR